ncbi:MAG TPA: HipA domain-containing protein, partial [Candidatus Nitrosotenuis sp.]|nr:HipA domain-containing protein [Candidatus Nitrosotenuis sp.]
LFFNILIGNNSAHGKNYSLIYHQDRIRLSPIYDIMSTEIYTSGPMAMSINSKFSFNDLKLKDIDAFCEEINLGKNYFKSRLFSFAQFLPDAADAIISKNPLLHTSPMVQKIRALLENRCHFMLTLLS